MFAAIIIGMPGLIAASVPNRPTKPEQLKAGQVITRSTTLNSSNRTIRMPNADDTGKRAAITIRGNNITVDFRNCTLEGTPSSTAPDQRKGTAVRVEGKNITIKNLRARGYKLGLVAYDSPGIKIVDCDFSYNWKQRLLSTLDREDGADWMSFHRNEKDEWLRYGCGIYLRRCNGFEVARSTIRGGQSGLYLMECNNGLVWNNDFSFLSAVGLAMYLSSDNRVMHNNIDWCVRGYSHTKWNRGQDSAGIIVYEQSMRNVFAYNSVTHGGDGFFLWAGQSTMDTGKGGCNDNLLYGNDFSHAPTNGIEATFSRNKFVNNLVMECWHGVWGGFSWSTLIQGNVFAYNAESIALEHGQENQFLNNIFYRDTTALAIWQNDQIDPNWGYGKSRDCRSRDTLASGNLFSNIPNLVMNVRKTLNFQFSGNNVVDTGQVLAPESEDRSTFRFSNNRLDGVNPKGTEKLPVASNIMTRRLGKPLPPTMYASGNVIPQQWERYLERFETNWDPFAKTAMPIRIGREPQGKALEAKPMGGTLAPKAEATLAYAPKPLAGGKRPFLRSKVLRGRRYILVDEWGPYDFQSPILWPRGETDATVVEAGREPAGAREKLHVFELLGQKGIARVIRLKGAEIVSISTDGGKSWTVGGGKAAQLPVPSLIKVRYDAAEAIDRRIELEYRGAKVVDSWGRSTPAGKPYRFAYSEFFAPIKWSIKWFEYDPQTQEPRSQYDAFQKLLESGTPKYTMTTDRLDFAGDIEGVRGNHFAASAEGTLQIQPGEYVLEVTIDDGARVWVDGKKVVDEWHWQGPTMYPVKLKLGGSHKIKLEYFEIDGYSTLKVHLRRS